MPLSVIKGAATRVWKGEKVVLNFCIVGPSALSPPVTGASAKYALDAPLPAPVLIIRGLGMTLEDSLTWAQEMSAATQRDIVIMDNRGSGSSSMPQQPYTFNDMADDCAEVFREYPRMRTAGRPVKFHLVGVSMGGLIAMKTAIRHPEQLASLIVGCSYAKPLDQIGIPARYMELALAEMPKTREARAVHLTEMFEYSFTEGWVEANPQRWKLLLKSFVDSEEDRLGNPGGTGQEGAIRDFAGVGMVAEAASISVPTLIATGDSDRLTDPRNSLELWGTIKGSKLGVIPYAGHLFWEMDSKTTHFLFADFFSRNDKNAVVLRSKL